MPPQKFFVLV